jgi:hypothetical protein
MGACDGVDTVARRHVETVVPLAKRDRRSVEFEGNPLLLEDLLDGRGDVLVLAGCQPGTFLDYGDPGTEAPVHLGELERDVAATDDDEMFGHRVEFEDPDIGHVVDIGKSRHVRDQGAATDIQKDPVRLQDLVVDPNGVRILEPCVSSDQRAVVHALEP